MVARRVLRSLKRYGTTVVLALVLIFGGISVWQAWDIATLLRREARETSRIYGQIITGLQDTGSSPIGTLMILVEAVRESGIPLVITDSTGRPTAAASIPTELLQNLERDPRVTQLIAELDRSNPPMMVPGGWQVHYGNLPVESRLAWLGVLQLVILTVAATLGVWAYRTSVESHRDRLWVAMARESAHQLGTPLMSASAWIDRLADSSDPRAQDIAAHLTHDLERLERVAKRFERIGRPARQDEVALGVLAERVANYFEPRLPRHAHRIDLTVNAPEAGPMIQADPVLVEWALEALVRNAIDALSGRGGNITIKVSAKGRSAKLAVSDDGPGVRHEVRANLFEPGVSTKAGGWGIGLALARRIVEDVHGGRLEIEPVQVGATFVATLPVTAESAV
ncbi:MAG: HAMP domain-containing histidine kinase [Gemmatimonadota bacterium]|nr:MAG: HAMP domain-containing histidine kinase [Gemmatimonadota bacterium]